MDDRELFSRFGVACSAGTVLFREGDEGRHMYVIQSGKVSISRNVGGKEALLAVLPPGEFFGEMAVVNDRRRTADATVVEDAKLLVIEAKTAEAMIRGNSEIAMRIIKKLADRLEQTNRQIEVLLHREPEHRVVTFLRNEAESLGRPVATGVAVSVTLERLAGRVGLTLPEVRKVLRTLEAARLVQRSGRENIIVAEPGKLQDFLDYLEMKDRYG